MDLIGRNLWQIGAGDTERNYGSICIDFDVMIMGPGNPGEYTEESYASAGKIRHCLRRFYKDAHPDDLVLLRLGTGQIIAVGQIIDEKPSWTELFSDVDGWDLQHSRRVRWFKNTLRSFPNKTLGGQVSTFSSVSVPIVREWVNSIKISSEEFARPLNPLPSISPRLTLSDIRERLIFEGLSNTHTSRLIDTIENLIGMVSWYRNSLKPPQRKPSEQETICYLVLPFFIALGWSQQAMAIEWKQIDIAIFSEMPMNNENLSCVIEAKSLGRSVLTPVGQAETYIKKPGRENCNRMIVTDGIRYALFKRISDSLKNENNQFTIHAYLNITELRERCPIIKKKDGTECKGAIDAILGMMKRSCVDC